MHKKKNSVVSKSLLTLCSVVALASSANAITLEKWEEAYFPNPFKQENIGTSTKGIVSSNPVLSSVGGARRTFLLKSSGVAALDITINTNKFSHSQGDEVLGSSLTIWDGSGTESDMNTVNPSGLGGLDFTTDGSTKFLLTIKANEFKAKSYAKITMSVYKNGDSVPYTITYTGSDAAADFPSSSDIIVTVPFNFSDFLNSSNQTYDFKDVGAITLEIDGTNGDDDLTKSAEALDVAVYTITTDGCTDYVPTLGYVTGYASPADKKSGAAKVCCDATALDECGICGGDSTSCADCDGTPNGTKQTDLCGQCLEPTDTTWNTSCADCDGTPNGTKVNDLCGQCLESTDASWNTSCADCSGEPNGTKVMDVCDVCGGDGTSCLDCANTPKGTKKTDLCGQCLEPSDPNWNKSCADCSGEPNGTKVLDVCGICGGDGTSCLDCAGTPNGTKKTDLCGQCLEPSDPNWNKSCADCSGEPNGKKVKDVCGICGGDGKSCLDCAGTPKGTKQVDLCGKCLKPSDSNWNKSCADCAGTPNGKKVKDVCGVCGGNGKSCLDCAGTPNGTKKVDLCGKCLDPKSPKWNTSCVDCSGTLHGKYKIDDCGECLDPYSPEWNLGLNTFNCTTYNSTDKLVDIEKWLTQQRKYLNKMLENKSYCKNNKRKKKIKSSAVSILSGAKATLDSFPVSVTSCETKSSEHGSCSTQSLEADTSSLTDAASELLKKTNDALKVRKNCISNSTGTCEVANGCESRLKRRINQIRKDRRDARELRKNTLEVINELPKSHSVCSCNE